MYVCVYRHLSLSLFLSLSIYMYIYIYTHVSIYLSIFAPPLDGSGWMERCTIERMNKGLSRLVQFPVETAHSSPCTAFPFTYCIEHILFYTHVHCGIRDTYQHSSSQEKPDIVDIFCYVLFIQTCMLTSICSQHIRDIGYIISVCGYIVILTRSILKHTCDKCS